MAGSLRLVRPSERGSLTLNEDGWLPLTFGPSWDSPNPKMGSVPRALFQGPELCAGCHEYEQPVLVPGEVADRARWPSGRLPVQSTFTEWSQGPYAEVVSCQGCHMPPDPATKNGADLQLVEASVGIAGGWPRPPGAVRSHAFVGPRTEGAGLLEVAAALDVDVRADPAGVEVRVTTTNVGAGHAIPTGEPARQLFVTLEAAACGVPLAAVGGEAVGPLGGATAEADTFDPDAWPADWPRPEVGDVLRAVRDGGFVDYDGPGAFAAGGRLTVAEKGRVRWLVAGSATVVSVEGPAVQLDRPLPSSDRVFLIRPAEPGPPALAGLPGSSFARVMRGADGRLAVPHHAAVDVARDDRLKPRGARTSTHRFLVDSACAEAPVARARLIYRPFPRHLTRQRRWDRADQVIAEGGS